MNEEGRKGERREEGRKRGREEEKRKRRERKLLLKGKYQLTQERKKERKKKKEKNERGAKELFLKGKYQLTNITGMTECYHSATIIAISKLVRYCQWMLLTLGENSDQEQDI